MALLAVLLFLHLYVGLTFMFGMLGLSIWAYVLMRRRQSLPERFFRALRLLAGLFGFQLLSGLLFIALGHLPKDLLHFLYAGLALLAVGASEMLRPTASFGRILREEGHFKEAGVFALVAVAAFLFALRLWMTGVGLP